MTAQQRTFAPAAIAGRTMGLALAAAFVAGLAGGLVAPRLAMLAPSDLAPAATVGRSTIPLTVNPWTGFTVPAGPVGASTGGITVNPWTGFTVRAPAAWPGTAPTPRSGPKPQTAP